MSLDNTSITETDHEAWLAERQNSIGASEAATVLGLNPWDSAVKLYLRKIGSLPPIDENSSMRIGKLMEPVIASLYQEETECEFTCFQRFVRSPTHPFITATLDCVRSDGRPVELKNVGARQSSKWGETETDEVPPHTIIQAMQQMYCSGTEVADVAALLGGSDFRRYTLVRDDRIINRIVEANEAFWDRVQRRDPPHPDPDHDRRVMANLWPEAVGEMSFGPIGSALVEEWEYHRSEVKSHETAKDRCQVQILDLMEDKASATLSDGRILCRKVIDVAEKAIITKPYRYVDLRVKSPRGDS